MPNWPLKKAYFWETAPFFRLLLPFIAGIVCHTTIHLKDENSLITISIITIACFVLFVIIAFINTVHTLLFNVLRSLLFNLVVFFLAYAVCYFNDIQNNKQWFGKYVGHSDKYIVRLIQAPSQKEKTWKLEITVLYAIQNNKPYKATGNAFIYVFKDSLPITYKDGDTILVPGKWTPISNSGNPYEFDYAGYCSKNNLYYQQFVSAKDTRLFAHSNANDHSLTEKAHNWCMKQLQLHLPDSSTMGLIQAMLLGDEINLDEHLLQAYSETGIVHIIAISGGNVTIFFLVISFLLFWLRNKKYNWIKYLVALPLVWFYVLMAGAAPSAIRAAIMFSVLAVGISLQKNNNSLNQLFATAFLLLCAEPMWLFSVGFQLSFVAVLSLILFYKPIYNLYLPVNIIAKGLWSTLCASIAAEILVAPLVIYYFHLFPLLFIIANVIAYLFMSLALILGMCVIAFSFLPAVADLIGKLTIMIVSFFDKVVYTLQNLNPLSFHYLSLKGFELLLVYIGISGITLFLLQKKKTVLFIGIAATCLLLVSFCINEFHALKQQKLVVYNMPGTNYIELIKGKYHSILYEDTGLAANKKNYILKPAHIIWRSWRNDEKKADEAFKIGSKTVLILNDKIQFTGSKFPVDYVIVNNSSVDITQIQKVFLPNLIILPSVYKGEKLNKLADEYGQSIFGVNRDGAFVLEAD